MPVTPDDVTNAYRWLLGREPDEKGLTAWLGTDSRADLRRAFLASSEFRTAATELPPLPAVERLPRLRTPNEIEWQADVATEVEFAAHIQRTWSRLGTERPHWSVLSADRFLPENINAYRTLFYASGAHEVDLILNILQSSAIDVARVKSVVEYGCGVGRVTPHLAARFQQVTAIDISETHLAMAREACADRPGINFKIARIPEFGIP